MYLPNAQSTASNDSDAAIKIVELLLGADDGVEDGLHLVECLRVYVRLRVELKLRSEGNQQDIRISRPCGVKVRNSSSDRAYHVTSWTSSVLG